MCKRFYVEVVGLGDDGRERLVEAGVREDAIMVIDEDRHNQPIIDAIRFACGVSFDDMVSQERRREFVVARMIYAHFAIMSGDSQIKIGHDLDKDRTTICGYLIKFDTALAYDKNFASAFLRVESTLVADPKWSPARVIKFNTEQKKGKKKHMKNKKKRKKVVLNPEEIEAIMEKRQLKIDWNNGK